MRAKNKEIKNSSVKRSMGKKKNLTAILIIGVLIVIIFGVLFFTLSKLFETEDYYVAAEQIPVNSKITKDKLVPISVPKGSAPPTALTTEKINENTFAQFTLEKSEVITTGNTGGKSDRHTGVPDEWVVTSITIPITSAANGIIVPGDYFDLVRVKEGAAQYLLLDALVLDVATTNGVITEEKDENVTTKEAGASLVYTIAMPEKLAAQVMGAASDAKDGLLMFRSPLSAKYEPNERDIDELRGNSQGFLEFTPDDLVDLRGDTDYTRPPVHRTSDGRPITLSVCEANDNLKEDEKDSSIGDICGTPDSKQREAVPTAHPESPNNILDADSNPEKESKDK